MAKCFVVKFPPNFGSAERERLTNQLDAQSFMQLPTYTAENQIEFLFESDKYTVESLRAEFAIPLSCEVLDSSNWLH